jgi:predicted DsbA family dithiol-disulfide isomerase
MHDLLLEKSPDLSKEQLLGYAAEVGLDTNAFKKDLEGMSHKTEIEADVKLAKELDFYNTPTFVINGRVVIGNRPYAYMKKVVEEELQRVK